MLAIPGYNTGRYTILRFGMGGGICLSLLKWAKGCYKHEFIFRSVFEKGIKKVRDLEIDSLKIAQPLERMFKG